MKSFQKGLLLGIGMVVACGTFVASKSSKKDTYTTVRVKDYDVVFTTYEKVIEGEYKNVFHKIKSETIFKHLETDLYKFKETEFEHKDGKVIRAESKTYLGKDFFRIEKYVDNSKDESYLIYGKGEKLYDEINDVVISETPKPSEIEIYPWIGRHGGYQFSAY